MSMEKLKKFAKDHKTEIVDGALVIAGVTLAAILGIKIAKTGGFKAMSEADKDYIGLLEGLNYAVEGSNCWVVAKPEEIWRAYDETGKAVNALIDPDGRLFKLNKLMVFGNLVE